jgi:hypothetical protein
LLNLIHSWNYIATSCDQQEATAKFGVTSPEARLAWEDVEDIENQVSSYSIFPKNFPAIQESSLALEIS